MHYDDINPLFHHHSFFYTVTGKTMNEALEYCARVTGHPAQVIQLNGQLVLATVDSIGTDISWLRPVPGNPDPIVEESAPTEPAPE